MSIWKNKAPNYLRLVEIHIYKDNKNSILTMFSERKSTSVLAWISYNSDDIVKLLSVIKGIKR